MSKRALIALLITGLIVLACGSVLLGRQIIRSSNIRQAATALHVDASASNVEAKVVCEVLARSEKFDKAVIKLKQIDDELRWNGGAPAGIIIFVKDFGFSFDYLDVYLDQDERIIKVIKIRQIGLTLRPTLVQC
ncbi:MAG: hypothetical protein HC853_18620 [Anaerolineae bacterium]|nr:hypothetical protein [Anaerolineae bacterium]